MCCTSPEILPSLSCNNESYSTRPYVYIKETVRHPSQLKRVPAVRRVDLAGYKICVLIRPKGVLWDLDRSSENSSPVFEHPLRLTTSVQALMCEWSSHPAGREMGLPRNIAIELEVQQCPECPLYISEFMFPITGTNGSRPKHDKQPHIIMLPPPNLTVGKMKSVKKRSPGIRQIQTRPSDFKTVKQDSSLQRTVSHMSTVQSRYALHHCNRCFVFCEVMFGL
ncbi:hypothetical protein TNCV_2762171 [Trichonephila clavipes]|nr:hypothetical protein TNCV_2762171 [Trichonephila clavipes]